MQNSVLSERHISEIQKWKRNNGNFNNFEEILDVKGFGAKTLEKCCNIVLSDSNISKNHKPKDNQSKISYLRLRIKPKMTMNKALSIRSFVTIRLNSNALTWVRFEVEPPSADASEEIKDMNVTHWMYNTIDVEKRHLIELHDDIVEIVKQIPNSDVYVCEELPNKPYRNNISLKQLSDQSAQLYAITLTLLSFRDATDDINDRNFYFLADKLMGR